MHLSFAEKRENMINGQLRPNRVSHPLILEAFRHIPREGFVPTAYKSAVYTDSNVIVDEGQYVLLSPLILGQMLQAAQVQKTDIVLNIGAGCGYSTALLSQLAETAIGLDNHHTRIEQTNKMLQDLQLSNASVAYQETLQQGWAAQGPYNVILLNGLVNSLLPSLRYQLSPDEGRLLGFARIKGNFGKAVLVTRQGDNFQEKALFEAFIPDLEKPQSHIQFTF